MSAKSLDRDAAPPLCVYTSLDDLHTEEEPQRAWAEKMADLEAIHQEIAPQVNAMRIALDDDDPEEGADDLEVKWFGHWH